MTLGNNRVYGAAMAASPTAAITVDEDITQVRELERHLFELSEAPRRRQHS